MGFGPLRHVMAAPPPHFKLRSSIYAFKTYQPLVTVSPPVQSFLEIESNSMKFTISKAHWSKSPLV